MEGSMEHFVRLDHLPDDVKFPSELSDRIRYDAQEHRLVFQGFMSKADFDRLIGVHSDWAVRRALEDLFRLCTPEEPAKPSPLRWLRGLMASLGLAVLVMSAGL
jgi:hypothetical protein